MAIYTHSRMQGFGGTLWVLERRSAVLRIANDELVTLGLQAILSFEGVRPGACEKGSQHPPLKSMTVLRKHRLNEGSKKYAPQDCHGLLARSLSACCDRFEVEISFSCSCTRNHSHCTKRGRSANADEDAAAALHSAAQRHSLSLSLSLLCFALLWG